MKRLTAHVLRALRATTLLLSALLLPTAPLLAADPSHEFDNGRDARGIPFELNSDKIYLNVRINEMGQFWFVLDTGSPGMIVDTKAAKRLGLLVGASEDVRGAGEAAFTLSHAVDALDVELPGMKLLDQPANVGPLDAVVGPFEGRRLDGVLGGFNIFADFVVNVDYQNRRIDVLPPADFEPGIEAHIVDVDVREGHAFFVGSVTPLKGEPVGGEFMLDTGLRGTGILHTPFVDGNNLIERCKPTKYTTTGGGVGGQVFTHVGRIRTLRFGGIDINDIYIAMSQSKEGLLSTDYAAGIIGSAVLQRFRAVFDYPRSRICLYDVDFDPDLLDFDKSGMFLVSDADERSIVKVIDVIEKSPAGRAGIQVGDRITGIDSTPASELGLERIRRMFHQPSGTALIISYERDGVPASATIILERVI